jgi:hypothetical protein
MYWANVPASNTIEKKVKEFQLGGEKDPLKFFLIPDEDDRKIAASFEKWKIDLREFQNYTRLNMVLSISSCFEVYLRSIVSLSLESRPGIILGYKESIDGVRLLKNNHNYRTANRDIYLFNSQLDSVIRGEWKNRASAYKNLFDTLPKELEQSIEELDKLRKLRNDIAHYFGRPKEKYEAPLIFEPVPIVRISHQKLIEYFDLVYTVAKAIDEHLYKDYIGSYEIIVCYYENLYKIHETSSIHLAEKAKQLQKMIGQKSGSAAGTIYYKELLKYFDTM